MGPAGREVHNVQGPMAPRKPNRFGAAVGPTPGMGARDFDHLLEIPINPGKEQNARIVDEFNRGQVTADKVLQVTSSCLNRAGNNWNSAVAGLQALGRCCHPQTGRGVLPDTKTYNAAISACEKAGRADKALELFDHLQTHGPARHVFPDTSTYNAVISACEKAGQVDRYADLLRSGIDGAPGRPETQVFPPSLGFNPGSNQLDLHEHAALTRLTNPTAANPGVHPAVARAIFHVLLKEPEKIWGLDAVGISDKTQFVVGKPGANSVKDAIAHCIRSEGWTPVYPLGLDNLPNLGLMMIQSGRGWKGEIKAKMKEQKQVNKIRKEGSELLKAAI